VFAAAGNEGSSVPHFPAAIPSVLAVGGSTAGDARYPWSNYGSAWVDLAAPGCNPAQGTSGVVNLFCGTSSATPFASGVAALLASTTPTPSPATIRNALMSTAVPLAGNWVASGRIDAAAALASLPFWVTGVRSGAYVGNSVTVTPHVSSSAITRVTASLDGAPVAVVTSSPWTLTIDTSGVTGPATITVTAYAGSSEAGVASFPIVADHAAPTVAFTQPAAGALVRGTVRVTATATDDVAVARVQLLVNHKIVATDTIAPYSFSWPSSAARLLELRAFDRAGNAVVVDRAVTVDNTPPTVVVTKAPANGARNVRGTQHLAVSAADAHGIVRLELAINGKITQTYAGRRHTFAVATSHYGSVMTVQVRAYDRAGNVRFAPARKWYR
jgi:thermitase